MPPRELSKSSASVRWLETEGLALGVRVAAFNAQLKWLSICSSSSRPPANGAGDGVSGNGARGARGRGVGASGEACEGYQKERF